MNIIISVFWFTILFPMIQSGPTSPSIEGYDCSDPNMQKVTYSMTELKDCNPSSNTSETKTYQGQILQKNTYLNTTILGCKVLENTLIFHCGMHSHSTIVSYSSNHHSKSITKEQCHTMHTTGIYKIEDTSLSIKNLKVGQIRHQDLTINGLVEPSGKCSPGYFNIGSTVYNHHVRKVSYSISLTSSTRKIVTSSMSVNLDDDLSCSYRDGQCYDAKLGFFYWDVKEHACRDDLYDVLYEGPINVTSGESFSEVKSILTVKSGTFILAAQIDKEIRICEIKVHVTAVDGLYISYQQNGLYQFDTKEQATDPTNIDLSRYINSKFGYLLYNNQIKDNEIYESLVTQLCKTNRLALQTKIELLKKDPMSVLSSEGFGTGVVVRPAGQVIHVFKCRLIHVTIRDTENCHHEIPVSSNGTEGFLTPDDRIFTVRGTVIPCSSMSPPTFLIKGKWYKFSPQMSEAITPLPLTPSISHHTITTIDWSLINGGIYSLKDVQSLQNFLSFGSRRSSMTSSSVADNMGISVNHDNTWIGSASDTVFDGITKRFFDSMDWIGIKFGIFGFFITLIMLVRSCISMIVKGIYLKRLTGLAGMIIGLFGGTFYVIANLFKSVSRENKISEHEKKLEHQEYVPLTPLILPGQETVYPALP